MKFVVISGPQAVGKMTVGQELSKITGLKLLHNHMTIELVSEIFNYDKEIYKKMNHNFRAQIFEEFAKSNQYGIIFTMCFDFNYDKEEMDMWRNIFISKGGECYFVELEATLEERLKRNKTENRLKNKPSKRNLEWSEKDILKGMKKYRLNSKPGEEIYDNYLLINNTYLSVEETAKQIKEKFNL